MDVRTVNRAAWDRQVESNNEWTRPVGPEVIAAARAGSWSVLLTEQRPVPREWFPPLAGRNVLCLASGGGQQGPILAAAGARVTVLDNSPAQLARDREVAERDGLAIALELGLMHDLSRFPDARFDLVFHPASNVFTPDVRPVWRECFRVLKPGGHLLVAVKAGATEGYLPELLGIKTEIYFSSFTEEEITGYYEQGGFHLEFLEKRTPYGFEIHAERLFAIGKKS